MDGELRNIQAVASAAGLRELSLHENNIADLSPLRALTSLETLRLWGNSVESLEPLQELRALEFVSIASHPFGEGLRDNPISDARALALLPRLKNVLTASDSLRINLFDEEAQPLGSGIATRIGNSHRFQFTPDGGQTEQILLTTLWGFNDLTVFPGPVVIAGIYFRDRDANAAMCTRPEDSSATLSTAELLNVRFGPAGNGARNFARTTTGGFLDVLLEVSPA